MVKNFWQRFGL